MKNIPFKRLKGINGELLATIEGRRHIIAKCRPMIALHERSRAVKVVDRQCYICEDYAIAHLHLDYTAFGNITADTWMNATGFELRGDFPKEDGTYHRMTFGGIEPLDEQTLDSDFLDFELPKDQELLDKLTFM